jgi:N-acetylmuramoyl-L-alanine amidase
MELIRLGDTGERVTDVQGRLSALGSDIPTSERGTFGEATGRAVRAFQEQRGLTADGMVGEDTWRTLVEASWTLGDRVLYFRSPNLRGDDVRELQDRLMTLGFDAWRVDGIFGPRTAEAVRDFQRNIGLTPDGIVVAETIRALGRLPRITGDTPAAHVRDRETLRYRPGSVLGMRIALDPGHGGDDSGHVGLSGVREADLCFHVVRRVEAILAASGAQVYVTRAQDDSPADGVRAALANVVEAEVFVSLHMAGGEDGARGVRAHYFGHERYQSETGKHLAELLVQEATKLGLNDRGAARRTLAILRETRMTAVHLEAGNLADADDERSLTDYGFQRSLAEALAEAIRRFAKEPVTV